MSQPVSNPPPNTEVVIQNDPMSGSGDLSDWSNSYVPPKRGDPCQKCGKRPSTMQWVGDGGMFALTHGLYQWWCEVCVLTEQLKHARASARRVPVLERKLAKAKAKK